MVANACDHNLTRVCRCATYRERKREEAQQALDMWFRSGITERVIYRVRFAMRVADIADWTTDAQYSRAIDLLSDSSVIYALKEIDAKKAATRKLRASGLAEHVWVIHIDSNAGESKRYVREKGLWIAE